MTAIPPDPEPAQTPDLESGGGVTPGATPPDSDQMSGIGKVEENPRRRITPGSVTTIVAVAVFALIFLAIAVVMVLNMTGVLD
ncbi:DUF6480 family protein [Mycolicibacterium monacense]|uniref:Uncharacterized protein n=2 Tax=Mycobacteriaceae TaxID=1762 RepID=A0AAD1IVV3_MYCMB|nr:DUF6480 family protein [Mycolicibacterium monacense]OBB66047.1 hypothetical protein A6B34_22250 [Mycolicibacterium monacense]OBF53907.1 hypothetical protein A5778_10970 [Mycolicibacterium monacense]ORB19785.1 hypothetical protein BST34_14340 [Mycolicibacterium monacense DSM 44395]QHP86415.1 hypothetical protein EWR22_14220 [Mycolicibacterium monacense DSM 44395]BBZ60557.1 hypothetical protein MMON_18580 [Mycolicibacterium monacense]